jgi:hypothetical protein
MKGFKWALNPTAPLIVPIRGLELGSKPYDPLRGPTIKLELFLGPQAHSPFHRTHKRDLKNSEAHRPSQRAYNRTLTGP